MGRRWEWHRDAPIGPFGRNPVIADPKQNALVRWSARGRRTRPRLPDMVRSLLVWATPAPADSPWVQMANVNAAASGSAVARLTPAAAAAPAAGTRCPNLCLAGRVLPLGAGIPASLHQQVVDVHRVARAGAVLRPDLHRCHLERRAEEQVWAEPERAAAGGLLCQHWGIQVGWGGGWGGLGRAGGSGVHRLVRMGESCAPTVWPLHDVWARHERPHALVPRRLSCAACRIHSLPAPHPTPHHPTPPHPTPHTHTQSFFSSMIQFLLFFSGIFAGVLYDALERHKRFGPRIVLLIGCVLNASGYFGLWAALQGCVGRAGQAGRSRGMGIGEWRKGRTQDSGAPLWCTPLACTAPPLLCLLAGGLRRGCGSWRRWRLFLPTQAPGLIAPSWPAT